MQSNLNPYERAHSLFQNCLTNGISFLRESGFSRQRAIQLLLKHIQQQDELPKDDEIIPVMKTLRLGYDQAMQCLIVGKAISRIQRQKEHLHDKLEALAFLTRDLDHYLSNFSQEDSMMTMMMISTTDDTIISTITSAEDASMKHPLHHATPTLQGPNINTPILFTKKNTTIASSTVKLVQPPPSSTTSSHNKTMNMKKQASLHKIKSSSHRNNKRKEDPTEEKVVVSNKEELVEQVKKVNHTNNHGTNTSSASSTMSSSNTMHHSTPNTTATCNNISRGKRGREDGLVMNNNHHSSSTSVTSGQGSVDGGSHMSPKRQRLDSI